ncbi:MFS transporter [Paenibacillus sp. KS-LC4]|uniref:MFS transporter n=1 Tax=Paenibacillus sp. KS-LC4 TaxID=2979727 RepID=UPI0030CE282A
MNHMKCEHKISIFFVSLFVLFELFRSFFQAIYSVYYLDRGLTIGDVSSVKSFQIVALLIFALPAGYLSDRFGRLKVLSLSALTMAISFLLLANSYNYSSFAVAEFVYGMGFAFSSGTLLSYTNQYQQEHNVRIKPSIMGYTISLSSLFTFISGSVGAYLYKHSIEIPFILSFAGMFSYPIIIYILLKLLGFKDNRANVLDKSVNKDVKKNKFESISEIKKPEFFLYLLCSILFVGGSQFIYQYWSVFFIVQNGFNSNLAYACTTVSSILGGVIFARFLSKKSIFVSILIICLVLSLPLFLMNEKYSAVSLLFFTISQVGRGMIFSLFIRLGNDIAFLFVNKSFMFQIVSVLTQLFTISSLLIIPKLLNQTNMIAMFHYTAIVYVLLIPSLLLTYRKINPGYHLKEN